VGAQNCDGALLTARPLMTSERPVDRPGCLPQLWSFGTFGQTGMAVLRLAMSRHT
jgi:hypothetical protein